MSNPTPCLEDVERRLAELDVDGWLELWQASQGGQHRQDRIAHMAAVLPLDTSDPVRVLDLFSGPGDVGRIVARRFPRATVDCIDGDPVLLGLCRIANRRLRARGQVLQRDAWREDWLQGIEPGYDVVCTAAALHWFDRERFSEILADIYRLLRPGGFLVFNEPTSTPDVFREALARWERECGAGWDPAAWNLFLERSLQEFGHAPHQPATTPAGRPVIGDDGIAVPEYLRRLGAAGFVSSDVIERRGSIATFVAQRPI